MTQLRIYREPEHPRLELESTLPIEIVELLEEAGIPYQHLQLDAKSVGQADFPAELTRMVAQDYPQFPLKTCARVILQEPYPGYDRIRMKYLSEHTSEQDEAYLVVDGRCQLNIHHQGKVFQLECEPGDFFLVPAQVLHWIDFGERAQLSLIRCNVDNEMPVINYTGSQLSDRFPRMGS
jgi:1,2-dihydroxy-3-keto-5-methylthiopentene dioxygenase